jgi:hypothetical protein
MKSTAAFILAVAAATLVIVCVVQARKSTSQQTQLASLKTELDVKAQQAEEAQAAQQNAEREARAAARHAEKVAAQLSTPAPVAVSASAPAPSRLVAGAESEQPAAEKGDLAKMMSRMMKDPASREFLRAQQRTMVDQSYAPLIKRMGLSPDEAKLFKDMQTDHMMNLAGKSFSMFGGASSDKGADEAKALTADQQSFDEQVKAFLGEDRYAQYQQYQETLAQRMQLNAYKLQAGSDYTLTEPQTETLLNVMNEEQKNAAAASGLSMGDADNDPSKLKALFSEGKFDQLMQAQESVNQRVYERAQSILSAEQLESFGQFQTNQLQIMRASMGMMKGLFGGDKASASTSLPAPPPEAPAKPAFGGDKASASTSLGQ